MQIVFTDHSFVEGNMYHEPHDYWEGIVQREDGTEISFILITGSDPILWGPEYWCLLTDQEKELVYQAAVRSLQNGN